MYGDYNYKLIGPREAIEEMGIEVAAAMTAKDAAATFAAMLPPVTDLNYGVIPEDPVIHALKKGIPVVRTDFDLHYAYMATRAHKSTGQAVQQTPKP